MRHKMMHLDGMIQFMPRFFVQNYRSVFESIQKNEQNV